MIRLLILLPGYQLFGQEQSLLTLALSLRESGVETHFLLHSKWGQKLAAELDCMGFPWTKLSLGSLWSLRLAIRNPWQPVQNAFAVARSSFQFIRMIKRMPFTHFLVGNATFVGYLLPALWVSSLPVIYRHGDDAAAHSIFHRFIVERIFRRAKVHVVNCRYLERQLKLRYSYLDPLVIYNAPREPGRGSPEEVRSITVVTVGGVRLVFVGQLSEQKGVLVLLQAFRLLAARHSSLVLDLVGDLPGITGFKPSGIADEVRRAVNEFPGRVIHHGFVKDPTALFSAAQIHVCPSIWNEASPNVVFEAKQNRLPSVVFDIGGIPELVTHLVDGYVCPECSSNSLATGIDYFLEDEDRRRRAGEAAFQSIVERFSRERLQQQWFEIFQPSPSLQG